MLKHQFKPLLADWKIIFPLVIILIIGFIMIFSTTSLKGLSEFNDVYFFIKRHSIYFIISILMFSLGTLIPIELYRKVAFPFYLFSIVLMALTLVPTIGVKVGGAQRWLNIIGFQFQPIEMMKFWWSVAVSLVLANKTHKINLFFKGVLPIFIIMAGPILCLLFQPDLGNTVLMLFVIFSLVILSPIPISVLVVTVIMSLIMVALSIFTHPYQLARINSFLNPWSDPLGANYHIIQSLTAIGSGGIFGFGIGESRLKYFYLPLNYSDFIFSVLCEEGGLCLAIILLIAFLMLFFRGMSIALKHIKYSFEQYLTLALIFFLVFQALINICVVIGLFPITGIPLTLVSYGGTSLLFSMFSLGVIYKLGRLL